MPRFLSPAFLSLACLFSTALSASVQVNAPTSAPGDSVVTVYPNFMGISLELSFMNYYFGNDTSSIPVAVLNYLEALHQRGAGQPVRLRVGGNSMDSSTYVPDQQQIIEFTDPTASKDDQPVTYGQVLFNIMKTTSDKVNSQWLIGLTLRDPNSTNTPLVASDAQKILGDYLDAALLGNEPDLYSAHGQRPNIANYTTDDYIGDNWVAQQNLQKTPTGDFLSLNKLAGPTICCFWLFKAVLDSGWLQDFAPHLKYLTLQHYPQNNCFGHYPFHLDWYMSHTNTVILASWQSDAFAYLGTVPADQRKPVLMDEFNSASCGGIPESNMFGMALWTADYGLQMAAVGYSAAYLHTREKGIQYNLFDPPAGDAGQQNGEWTTNPNFYAMLAVNEALQSSGGQAAGTKVVDLNIDNSVKDYAAVHAGYAVYDVSSSQVQSLVLFNYANASLAGTDFQLPASLFSSSSDSQGTLTVRYLTASTATETTQVTYGNLTYAGVTDGIAVTAPSTLNSAWTTDKEVQWTKEGGATVSVPGPGLAVVFVGGAASNVSESATTANGTSGSGSASTSGNGNGTSSGKTNASSQNSGAVANGRGMSLVGGVAGAVLLALAL
ncbi:hypothetical protein BDY19DRAFT_944395 [Irpex rosettiformis]|uniref:Uncharacterized protein n=1 Tax=Irpex rosettiformis TaxID=378272 RepID=A0ACB8U472_9APHY|nr:hypothetical protein BDY19DRAFT_944395 [Irpex rosettiformis]